MLYVYFVARQRCLTDRLIRVLGRCHFTHVCHGDRDTTIDVRTKRDCAWQTCSFIAKYPDLCWMVSVPTLHPPVVCARNVRLSTIPTWIRWITRRPVATGNCVERAVNALRTGGIVVPDIDTPDRLWDWLRGNGYPLEPLTSDYEPCKDSINEACAICRSQSWRT